MLVLIAGLACSPYERTHLGIVLLCEDLIEIIELCLF